MNWFKSNWWKGNWSASNWYARAAAEPEPTIGGGGGHRAKPLISTRKGQQGDGINTSRDLEDLLVFLALDE